MVDSRQKGARAEAGLKKLLRDTTGLNFQRTPGSGALNETHRLKGDIYLPNTANRFCIEVKHYKDDHLTSKLLTGKDPQLLEWWGQAMRQADQVDMLPLLFFKFDRSKWFVGFDLQATGNIKFGKYKMLNYYFGPAQNTLYLAKAEDWLEHEDIKWTL